jgi:hypothetical protein
MLLITTTMASIIILPLLIPNSIFGQIKKQNKSTEQEVKDTTHWYFLFMERHEKLNIKSVKTCKEPFYFRFTSSQQIIDIWSNDLKTFQGLIVNYIDTFEPRNRINGIRKPHKTLSNHIEIDTLLARQTYFLIQTILDIPSGDSIKGWESGFDGTTYHIETSFLNNYSKKNYWSPDYQDSSIKEVRLIQYFISTLNTSLNLEEYNSKFHRDLKPGRYMYDNIISIKLSQEEAESLKEQKEYENYLKYINDTLNQYLNDTLNKLIYLNKKINATYTYLCYFPLPTNY